MKARVSCVLLSLVACGPGVASGGSTDTSGEPTEGGDETETESDTETDTSDESPDPDLPIERMDCTWTPAPPSECVTVDQMATPGDFSEQSPPEYPPRGSIAVGPDGSIHAVQLRPDGLGLFFVHFSNESGAWAAQAHHHGLSFDSYDLPFAVSASGVLHALSGGYIRIEDGGLAHTDPFPDAIPIASSQLAWSSSQDFGYAFVRYLDQEVGDYIATVWSIEGDCVTRRWIQPPCNQQRWSIAMDADDRLRMAFVDQELGFGVQTFEDDQVTTTWIETPSAAPTLPGELVIDDGGTMHLCYSIDPDPDDFTMHVGYARFIEAGDWQAVSIPEMLSNPQRPCSLAIDDSGSTAWVSSYAARNWVARIGAGSASLIPTDFPLSGEPGIHDIALDAEDRPVVFGHMGIYNGDAFVARRIGDAWTFEYTLEH